MRARIKICYGVAKISHLKTFMQNFPVDTHFLKFFLLLPDNDLLVSEMQKNWGQQLCFRDKACGKVP